MTIDVSLIKNPELPQPNDPSIPNPTPLKFGTHYLFQLAGVELKEHTHTPLNMHVTVVMSGSFTCTVGGVDRTVSAGDIIDLNTTPHSFVSLEDNSSILNIIKLGVTRESVQPQIDDVTADLDALGAKIAAMKELLV